MKTQTVVILGVAAFAGYWFFLRKPARPYVAPPPVTPRPDAGHSTADTVGAIIKIGTDLIHSLSGPDSGGESVQLVDHDEPGFLAGLFGSNDDNLVAD